MTNPWNHGPRGVRKVVAITTFRISRGPWGQDFAAMGRGLEAAEEQPVESRSPWSHGFAAMLGGGRLQRSNL